MTMRGGTDEEEEKKDDCGLRASEGSNGGTTNDVPSNPASKLTAATAASPSLSPPTPEPTSPVSREENGGNDPSENSTPTASASASGVAAKSASAPLSYYCTRLWKAWCSLYSSQDFLIQIIIAICLAKAYPPLGADYLQPKITASWVAVIFIFILSGWALPTEDFGRAITHWRFCLLVQTFCFGVDSVVGFGVATFLLKVNAVSEPLANGLVVCSCLSVSINVAIILTTNCGGDVASSIFNTAVSNVLGVVLSPLLILGYLGFTGDVDLPTVLYQLALKVIVPLFVGQCIRNFVPGAVPFSVEHKWLMKKLQQWALVYIIYTVFCKEFAKQGGAIGGAEIVIMIFVVAGCFFFLLGLAWFVFGLFFSHEPKMRISGLFGSTQKTISMGVPLINSMFGNDPNIASITLPLLIWFNLQLIVGSLITPRMLAWVQREQERLLSGEDTAVDSEGGNRVVVGEDYCPSRTAHVDPEGGEAATLPTAPTVEDDADPPTPAGSGSGCGTCK